MDQPKVSHQHPYVTKSSGHAPIQKNMIYVQPFMRSIYQNRLPRHPHLPIHQYEQRPQGPSPCPRYMEYCPFHRHVTSRTTTASTDTSTALCISAVIVISTITPPRYEPVHLIFRREPHHWHQNF